MTEGEGRKEAGRRLEAFVKAHWSRDQGGIRGLASQLGSSADTVYSWFRGEHPPDAFDLEALGGLLDVSRWEIVAAMDGVEAIDLRAEATKTLLAGLIDQALDARGVPPPPAPRRVDAA